MFLNVPLSCQYQHFVAVVIVYKSRGSRLIQDSCLNFLGASLDLLVSPWMFVSSPGSPIFPKQVAQKEFCYYIGSTLGTGWNWICFKIPPIKSFPDPVVQAGAMWCQWPLGISVLFAAWGWHTSGESSLSKWSISINLVMCKTASSEQTLTV